MTHIWTERVDWQEYTELIRMAGIEDADSRSFSVRAGGLSVHFDLPDGLTEDVYKAVAPLLPDENKPVLAIGVLRHLLQARTNWEQILLRQYGCDVDERLTVAAETKGFTAVAGFIQKIVIAYRKNNPPARLYLSAVRSPRWDAPMLSLGDMRWHFRYQDGPVTRLLDALEAKRDRSTNCWPAWVEIDLDPDQVRDAAKYLRNKTGSHLEWSAEADGRLSWSLKP